MATTFPTTLDALTNPLATDGVATVSHSSQHANANDAIEALEAKVGINSSAVTTSHDYKLSEILTTDKAVGKTATQTISGKTLTAPRIVNNGFIADANGNEQIEMVTVTSAVNNVRVTNAITAGSPLIDANGSDSNIDLTLKGKGTGKVKIGTVALQFPNVDGSNTQVLQTNGSGVLSWVTPSSGAGVATSLIPKPEMFVSGVSGIGRSINTEMHFGLIEINQSITVNKLSFFVNAYTASGTLKIALFSQDGLTQYINVTSGTVSAGSTLYSVTVGAVTLSPGKYYLASLITGTGNFEVYTFSPVSALYSAMNLVTSEPYYQGIKTVTASTMPATFDPSTSVTASQFTTLVTRMDN